MGRQGKAIIGFLLILCLGAALFWSWQTRREEGVSTLPVAGGMADDGFDALRREIRANFQKAADMLRPELPKAMGEGLYLTAVEVGDGPSMRYVYSLTRVGGADLVAKEKAWSTVTQAVCGNPDMRDYMPYGVHYDYVYQDMAGREIYSLSVTEEVCSRLQAPPAAPAAEAEKDVPAAAGEADR